jgi:hypothetical protein
MTQRFAEQPTITLNKASDTIVVNARAPMIILPTSRTQLADFVHMHASGARSFGTGEQAKARADRSVLLAIQLTAHASVF